MTPGAGSSVRGDYSATKGPCHQTGASLCRAGRPTSSEPAGPVELPGHDPRGGGCAKFLPIVSARRGWLYTFLQPGSAHCAGPGWAIYISSGYSSVVGMTGRPMSLYRSAARPAPRG